MRLAFLSTGPFLLHTVLLATSSRQRVHQNTWFLDGCNLMGHKGTPKDRQTVADKLSEIQAGSNNEQVILVFDGAKTTTTTSGSGDVSATDDGTDHGSEAPGTGSTLLSVPTLSPGQSADDYIAQEIHKLLDEYPHRKHRVHVVTADRALRRRVLGMKPIVYCVVNPVVFWRRYLPRLCGWKQKKAEQGDERSA